MDPNKQDKLVLPAGLEHLGHMLSWVRGHAEKLNFSSLEVRQIELAMEEALVNVINYAYKGKTGEVEIDVQVLENKKIEYKIVDRGQPFNPLKIEIKIDTDQPLEERKEGGLGVALIKQCMDEVFYEWKNSCNILTLIKKRK